MDNTMIQGWKLTAFEEKIKLAKKQIEKKSVDISKIIEKIKEGLDSKGLKGTYEIYSLRGLSEIREWEKKHKDECARSVFLKFENENRVAVVGAGEKRLVFSKVGKNSKCKVSALMANCGCDWSEDDKKEVIRIVFCEGSFDGIHVEEKTEFLKYRDGIEYLVGEILIKNDVPIIDILSHRNWKLDKANILLSKS